MCRCAGEYESWSLAASRDLFAVEETGPCYYVLRCRECSALYVDLSIAQGAGSYSLTSPLSADDFLALRAIADPDARYAFLERRFAPR